MFSIKKFIIIFFLLIPISNSFGAMVTEVDSDQAYSFLDGGGVVNGIAFNPDGTKMFVSRTSSTQFIIEYNFINEYNLPHHLISFTKSYAGDSERCVLNLDGTSTSSL